MIALLERPNGVTLTEVTSTTGCQAHSIRGFISGTLRKKLGLTITGTKNPAGEHTYRITS